MSSPFTNIACCIDESAASVLALAEARRLRALGPGRLSVLHAPADMVAYPTIALTAWLRHPSELRSDAEAWLGKQVAEGEVPILLSGYPPATACEWALHAGCDLMVVAAHRTVTERVFLGGFATFVAYHAPCAVLLIRPAQAPSE
jgi:nucleotide-binding universal stress UspA family protein